MSVLKTKSICLTTIQESREPLKVWKLCLAYPSPNIWDFCHKNNQNIKQTTKEKKKQKKLSFNRYSTTIK